MPTDFFSVMQLTRLGAALVLGGLLALLVLATRGRQPRDESVRRGASVLARARRHGRVVGLTLAGESITPADECKHFKLIGTTGTGKSTAIAELLQGALERGDRAVICDPDGGYAHLFWHRYRGDALLNPFDARSRRWDLFAELQQPYDIEQLVSALISSSEDAASQEWRGYARTLVAALLQRCVSERWSDVATLWRLLAIEAPERVRELVAGTSAQPFFEPDNARMLGSIRSVACSAMGALQYLQQQRAAPLSIRSWIRDGHGVLFLPYRASQIAALRSMIAAWMRLAIFETMNASQTADQHLWFVVDELDALGAIDGLKDALARLRKFGGRCVLGLQSIAQVSSTYGVGEAQTIVENCGNTLILRCASSEHGGTAQFAARLIGEREVVRRQRTRSHDRAPLFGGPGRRSVQVSEQRLIEPAVLASEIEQLPDLCGYLKTVSDRRWRRVQLRAAPAH